MLGDGRDVLRSMKYPAPVLCHIDLGFCLLEYLGGRPWENRITKELLGHPEVGITKP